MNYVCAICKYDVSTIWRTCIHNILSNQRHTLSTFNNTRCHSTVGAYCDRHARCEHINHTPLTLTERTMQNMLSVALKMFFAHVVVILSFSHHSNISSGVLISQQKPRWLWWIRKVDMIQVSIIYKKYLENGKKLWRLNCLQHE